MNEPDEKTLMRVREAAIVFLATWRASLGGNARAWLAEDALEEALVASGVAKARLRGPRAKRHCV
jgi:hypothetical protein